MSHRAVSGHQMGQQLKMFMTPDEIIDTADKLDSPHHNRYDPSSSPHPREQWERDNQHGVSLRDYKRGALRSDNSGKKEKFEGRSWDTAPPVELAHYGNRATLVDGHHRLAWAEMRKIPYMAVTHHEGDDW